MKALKNFISESLAIDESYGVYNGLDDLIDYIMKDIKDFIKEHGTGIAFRLVYDREELKELKNIYFGELEVVINLTDNSGGAAYIGNFNEETLLIDKIEVDVASTNVSRIPGFLKHEFTHGYTDWNAAISGCDKFKKIASTHFYRGLQPTPNMSFSESYTRSVLYFTMDYERSAFIAQLTEELRVNKAKIKTPDDALQIILRSQIYSTYRNLYDTIVDYNEGNLDDESVQEITDEYNKICQTKLSSNKVFKKLKFLMEKSIKKINSVIKKIILQQTK